MSPANNPKPTVLWWSRGDRGYSRDRIVRAAFQTLGWKINDFCPTISQFGDVEASLRSVRPADLVWVPCFRQRDAAAAQRWASKRGVPIVLDPLISAWDKRVFERRKFAEDSFASQRLLRWESRLFQNADVVVADTQCHADFFHGAHQVDRSKLTVIPVSAEEGFFTPQPTRDITEPINVLFYGSFIGLQGPQHIATAAKLVPDLRWTFIGSGPLLEQCKSIAADSSHVEFISRVPYETLPTRIGAADILLGVFGTSPKAERVIPNKVYQSLACGRPVITQRSDAYPSEVCQMTTEASGLTFVDAGKPIQIADAVSKLASNAASLRTGAESAQRTFRNYFGENKVRHSVAHTIELALSGKTARDAA